MRRAKVILFLTIFLTSYLEAAELTFDQDVNFKLNNTKESQILKSNTALKVNSGDIAIVSADGLLPLLILSAESSNSKINFSKDNLNTISFAAIKKNVETSANEIVKTIRKTDYLIHKRNYNAALNELNVALAKYENISELYFIRASVHYLLKNSQFSKEDLDRGLALDPENERAKKLKEQLKG